jgi:hypothetical protein
MNAVCGNAYAVKGFLQLGLTLSGQKSFSADKWPFFLCPEAKR